MVSVRGSEIIINIISSYVFLVKCMFNIFCVSALSSPAVLRPCFRWALLLLFILGFLETCSVPSSRAGCRISVVLVLQFVESAVFSRYSRSEVCLSRQVTIISFRLCHFFSTFCLLLSYCILFISGFAAPRRRRPAPEKTQASAPTPIRPQGITISWSIFFRFCVSVLGFFVSGSCAFSSLAVFRP